MPRTIDLSKVSNEDLIRELTNRPGIVLDIWRTEDVLRINVRDWQSNRLVRLSAFAAQRGILQSQPEHNSETAGRTRRTSHAKDFDHDRF
jgi:hypothetical protein